MSDAVRIERDFLGELAIPTGALHGIHTARALENFPLAAAPGSSRAGPRIRRGQAGLRHHQSRAGRMDGGRRQSRRHRKRLPGNGRREPRRAHRRGPAAGRRRHQHQHECERGAGQPRAGNARRSRGAYERVSPLDDLNLHQSTNDTYPTALKLAAIRLLHALERRVVALQESFQDAEKRFAHVVKVGRTQMQDAVLTTLGREMSAYAEAINRDRWRIYKCEERLRVVNLGGTAIGTGLSAPRPFIFQRVENLRDVTGIGFARAENLMDATQNADVFVEVSGILKRMPCRS